MTKLYDDSNWLTPLLIVSDIEKSIEFYKNAFDMKNGSVLKDADGKPVHANISYQDKVLFMLGIKDGSVVSPSESKLDMPCSFYVYVDDVDSIIEKAEKNGGVIQSKPEDMFWGDRMGTVKDINGYIWNFATKVKERNEIELPSGFKNEKYKK